MVLATMMMMIMMIMMMMMVVMIRFVVIPRAWLSETCFGLADFTPIHPAADDWVTDDPSWVPGYPGAAHQWPHPLRDIMTGREYCQYMIILRSGEDT